MIKFFRDLLGFNKIEKKPVPNSISSSYKEDFTVEHYPLTKRFYAKYKGYYLNKDVTTGIVSLIGPRHFSYVTSYGKTLEEAKQIIPLFKEQRLKENVKIIKLE